MCAIRKILRVTPQHITAVSLGEPVTTVSEQETRVRKLRQSVRKIALQEKRKIVIGDILIPEHDNLVEELLISQIANQVVKIHSSRLQQLIFMVEFGIA
jgi:hypothetical protein